MAWRTRELEHVEAFGRRFEEQGLEVERLAPDEVRSVGEAAHVQVPGEHPFLFYHDVEQPEAPG